MSGISAISNDRPISWWQFYRASNIAAAKNAALSPSQPELPVEPVSPVQDVLPDTAVDFPVILYDPQLPPVEALDDAEEILAKMRIEPFDASADAAFELFLEKMEASRLRVSELFPAPTAPEAGESPDMGNGQTFPPAEIDYPYDPLFPPIKELENASETLAKMRIVPYDA